MTRVLHTVSEYTLIDNLESYENLLKKSDFNGLVFFDLQYFKGIKADILIPILFDGTVLDLENIQTEENFRNKEQDIYELIFFENGNFVIDSTYITKDEKEYVESIPKFKREIKNICDKTFKNITKSKELKDKINKEIDEFLEHILIMKDVS